MQLSNFETGTVVVHKSLGSQPLVVTAIEPEGYVSVRYATQTQSDGTVFVAITFNEFELETPVASIEREGEIFKVLNAKRQAIQDEADGTNTSQLGPIPINKLN